MLKRHDNLFYWRVINCLRCHGGSAYLGSPPMFPFLAHPLEVVSDLENTYAHFCAIVLLDRYTVQRKTRETRRKSGIPASVSSSSVTQTGSREFTVLYIL